MRVHVQSGFIDKNAKFNKDPQPGGVPYGTGYVAPLKDYTSRLALGDIVSYISDRYAEYEVTCITWEGQKQRVRLKRTNGGSMYYIENVDPNLLRVIRYQVGDKKS